MTSAVIEQLRSAREALGLTLADVAHETRIPVERLKLIEEGKLASIGNMTYARSFLRKYAAFLGVDSEPLAASLPQSILGGVADYRYLTQSHGPWVAENQGRLRAATAKPRKKTVSPFVKAAALITVVGSIGIWWAGHVKDTIIARSQATAVAKQSSPEAVALSVRPSIEVATSSGTSTPVSSVSQSIPWEKLNKSVVQRAQIVEDSDVKKAVGAAEVRKASPVEESVSSDVQ